MKQIWPTCLLIIKGMAYGITHIAPGLGGGLVLIMMGIYEQFVDHIGNFFVDLKRWKDHLSFLVPLGIGMVLGMVLFAKLVDVVHEHYPVAMMVFFIGLLLGTIPSVFKLHGDMKISVKRGIAAILGLALVVLVSVIQPSAGAWTIERLSTASGLAYNSLVCFFAGGASVTPGLDGSYVLMLGKVYHPVVEAVGALLDMDIHFALLASTGVFAALGILIVSKGIDVAIKRIPSLSYYFVLGLILGSVYGLWPQQTANVGWLVLVLCFAAGFAIAWFLGGEPEEA